MVPSIVVQMTTGDRLKKMFVEEMLLPGVTLESIEDDAPLFDGGVGLDSLDAIELVLLVKERFGVVISDADEGREAFRSVSALAEYIDRKRPR